MFESVDPDRSSQLTVRSSRYNIVKSRMLLARGASCDQPDETCVEFGVRCAHLAAHCAQCKKEEERVAEFKMCSRCGYTQYCSSECQEQHWLAGHGADCVPDWPVPLMDAAMERITKRLEKLELDFMTKHTRAYGAKLQSQ